MITDQGIKSTINVQNASEHGNGMVGFEVGPLKFWLPSKFLIMVDQRKKTSVFWRKIIKK